MFKIDYPMWSIPIEAWLYVVFALALVPFWRRVGTLPVLLSASILGFGASFLLRENYAHLRLHFLSLFTFGMAGAALSFSAKEAIPKVRSLWAGITGVSVLAYVFLQWKTPPSDWVGSLPMALAAGVATTAMLIWGASHKHVGSEPRFLLLLEHPICVWLGTTSYSLYLIHAPILSLVHLLILRLGIASNDVGLAIELLIGLPVCLLGGYVLWRFIERPSIAMMSRR